MRIMIATLLAVCSCVTSAPSPAPPTPEAKPAPTPEGEVPTTAPCVAEVPGSETFDTLANEKVGGLMIAASAADVRAALGEPEATEGPSPNEAAGGFDWEWRYPSKGTMLIMSAETETGEPSISAMSFDEAATAKTRFGIGIGSSADEVRTAYAACLSAEDSSEETIVAGSIYGGVLFTIRDGRVAAIFVGAGAE